jgi:hypothetical protein
MGSIKLTNYNEQEMLADLLMNSPCGQLSAEDFHSTISTLLDNGTKYPPFKPGSTCYYLDKQETNTEVDDTTESFWTVESAKVQQVSFNDFGDWLLLADFALHDVNSFGYDIFATYAEAQLECDKRNSKLAPEV